MGAVILAVRRPVPVLPIVMVPDAVAPGTALKLNVFLLTEICPGPGSAVGVGVAVCVMVAVGVEVAVAVAVGVPLVVAVAVGEGTDSG